MKKTLIISSMVLLSSYSIAVSCKNFSTQQQAQAYFNSHNARGLDRNHDGVACESLPRGSSSSHSQTHTSKPKAVAKVAKSKPIHKAKAHVEEVEEEVVVAHAPVVKKAKKKKLRMPFVPLPVVEAEEAEEVVSEEVITSDVNVTQKMPLSEQDISILDKI